jgi:putative phosphonate catabolism associated alcohol dehydrogenase
MNRDHRSARAAVLVAPNSPFEIRNFRMHRPDVGQVLVKVSCCTLCGSDVHAFTGKRKSDFLPAIVGHEIAGVVEELGPSPPAYWSGEPLALGDRVTFSMMASCGNCFYCTEARLPQKCQRLFKYGHTACTQDLALTGGLSEFVYLVKGTTIYRLSDAISDEVAATAMCAGATLEHAFEGAHERRMHSVLLVGMGMLGLWAIRIAMRLGFEKILCLDIDQDRLAFSLDSGSTHILDASNLKPEQIAHRVSSMLGGEGPDLTIEMSGTHSGVCAAFLCPRTGGQINLVGSVIPTDPLLIDPYDVVRRSLLIKGIHNYRPEHLARALALTEDESHHHAIRMGVSSPIPLASVDSAFQDAIRHKAHRILITN